MRRQHDDGTLVAIAAHDLAGLAAIHVGEVHVKNDDVCGILFQRLHTNGGGCGITDNEIIMQGELFHQRAAQHVIIVNEQNLFLGRHGGSTGFS